VRLAPPAERSVEDITPSNAYISWFNGRAIEMMSLYGNQE
jgi:hypothetical protein